MKNLIILFLLSLITASFVIAQSSKEKDALIQALAASEYVPDGNSSGPVIYVIGYTTCPWLKKLYADSRVYTKKVEFRWVFYPPAKDLDGIEQGAYLANKKDPIELEAVMNSKRWVGPVENGSDAALAINHNRKIFLEKVKPLLDRAPSPTLVYLNSDKVQVQRGYPDKQLRNIVEEAR